MTGQALFLVELKVTGVCCTCWNVACCLCKVLLLSLDYKL